MVLNCLAEFCLKLAYRYLFKADHVPGDTWSGAFFGPRGIICYISNIKALGLMVSDKKNISCFFPI